MNKKILIIGIVFILIIVGLVFFFMNKERCFETDSGNDLFTKGTTTGLFGSPEKVTTNEDRCIGMRVREYFCEDKYHQVGDTLDCPEGMSCSEGSCQ